MSENEKYTFPGTKINVEWDGRLCIHIAECGHAKGELFVAGRQPWCQPDLVALEDVIDVVERCPSGALTYETSEKTIKESPDQENSVAVSYNGPYFVRGELDIENSADDMEGVAFRVALCRCGHSKSKPFCDNSHEAIGFKDYAAVGDKGKGLTKKGGKLKIKSLDDGPLLLSGNITIKNGSGRVAWQGTEVALCRCGASESKPFCDGSHVAAGFKSK
ncbi:MAG: CDGSH iron-sulfur domain-containing protein [Gammaproteobacteria bacterium]|nr:MAG: CDGSH iron-sulfur domain-containing protein [Gammaproteobacteria bacterium]